MNLGTLLFKAALSDYCIIFEKHFYCFVKWREEKSSVQQGERLFLQVLFNLDTPKIPKICDTFCELDEHVHGTLLCDFEQHFLQS